MKLASHNAAHGALVRACLEYLRLRGIHAWQAQAGAVRTRQGRWVRLSPAGTPDILGIVPGSGRLIGIEVKTGKGRRNKAQRAWHEAALRAGALVLTVRDVRELVRLVEEVTTAGTPTPGPAVPGR